jgi:hypothetical protein
VYHRLGLKPNFWVPIFQRSDKSAQRGLWASCLQVRITLVAAHSNASINIGILSAYRELRFALCFTKKCDGYLSQM